MLHVETHIPQGLAMSSSTGMFSPKHLLQGWFWQVLPSACVLWGSSSGRYHCMVVFGGGGGI